MIEIFVVKKNAAGDATDQTIYVQTIRLRYSKLILLIKKSQVDFLKICLNRNAKLFTKFKFNIIIIIILTMCLLV